MLAQGDPGWDMSAYMAYNNGAQNFAYRRKLGTEVEERDRELERRRQLWQERESNTPGNLAVDEFGRNQSMQMAVVSAAGRQLQSATEADWRNRMVFYTGDERVFYQGLDGRSCEPTSAIFDPSCRTIRKVKSFQLPRGDVDKP